MESHAVAVAVLNLSGDMLFIWMIVGGFSS
jgi:hypothetical protein